MHKMAQELAEYKTESKELRNQDGIIKRLEERIRSLEAAIDEKVCCNMLARLLPLRQLYHTPSCTALNSGDVGLCSSHDSALESQQ